MKSEHDEDKGYLDMVDAIARMMWLQESIFPPAPKPGDSDYRVYPSTEEDDPDERTAV